MLNGEDGVEDGVGGDLGVGGDHGGDDLGAGVILLWAALMEFAGDPKASTKSMQREQT